MEYLMSFSSTAHAIRAESVLLKDDITLKIKPLPNEISSGCGITVVFEDLESVKKSIGANELKYDKLYSYDEVYKEIKL